MDVDFLIAGAGYAGSICAQQLAEAGFRVHVVDQRSHIAGNAFDRYDEHGVLIHPYGPHCFHTNSKRIVEYLSRFTTWRFYEHRVLADVDGQLVPIPINRTTINKLYGLNLTDDEVASYLASVRVEMQRVETSEDAVLSQVGHDLCDKFFRGYTRKQWGKDLSELAASVAARIPTRTNDDDRYFTDTYQLIPTEGYTKMFERMLDSPLITVQLETTFESVRDTIRHRHVVYTGPIDAYFDYRHGRLPYRSLRFEYEHFPDEDLHQPVGAINYPNRHEYTRIAEYKHLTGQQVKGTSVSKEFPSATGDPYYPVPSEENERVHRLYRDLANQCTDVTFVGRLAEYRYYNMDQVVGAALTASARILERFHEDRCSRGDPQSAGNAPQVH